MTFPHVKHRIGMIILIDLLQKPASVCQLNINEHKTLNCKILRLLSSMYELRMWAAGHRYSVQSRTILRAADAAMRSVPNNNYSRIQCARRRRSMKAWFRNSRRLRNKPSRLLRSNILLFPYHMCPSPLHRSHQ